MKATEQQEQQTLFDYCYGLGGNLDNRLKMLFVIANGAWRGMGRMEAGMVESAGIPDVCLPIPIYPFHALFIELKTATGKPSIKQRVWQKRLRDNGYASEICFGADQAITVLQQYLAGELPPF